MPGFDRSGPLGGGPATGGGFGYCARGLNRTARGYGRAGRGFGRCFGRGLGRGYGWRNAGRYADAGSALPADPAPWSGDEKALMRREADRLRSELKEIESRLSEVEATGEASE